jgi:hypothetical protein
VRTKLRKICFDGQFPFDPSTLSFLGPFRVTTVPNVLARIAMQFSPKPKPQNMNESDEESATHSVSNPTPHSTTPNSARLSDSFRDSFLLFELPQEHLSTMLINKGKLPISTVEDLKRYAFDSFLFFFFFFSFFFFFYFSLNYCIAC